MTRVFVSHSSEDKYFVDFLAELLRFHRVDVWVDRNDLRAGAEYAAGINEALVSADVLVVVLSPNAYDSPWITREISVFKTANPDRRIIPLALVADMDADKIFDGLGQVQYLQCYESLLVSFKELLELLGRTLFPAVERRNVADRRSGDRRQGGRRSGRDRRQSPIEMRLRVGINKGYEEATGRPKFESLQWGHDVGRFSRLLTGPDSPLLSFDFADRLTGEATFPDFRTLEVLAYKSWEANSKEDLRAIVYITDDIVKYLVNTFDVTQHDRRDGERRAEERRTGDRRTGERSGAEKQG